MPNTETSQERGQCTNASHKVPYTCLRWAADCVSSFLRAKSKKETSFTGHSVPKEKKKPVAQEMFAVDGIHSLLCLDLHLHLPRRPGAAVRLPQLYSDGVQAVRMNVRRRPPSLSSLGGLAFVWADSCQPPTAQGCSLHRSDHMSPGDRGFRQATHRRALQSGGRDTCLCFSILSWYYAWSLSQRVNERDWSMDRAGRGSYPPKSGRAERPIHASR